MGGQPLEGAEKAVKARHLRTLADEIDQRLTPPNSARTMPNMAQPATEAPRRRGRPTKSTHPFPMALEAKGSNVAAWADAHGIPRETAKSWHSRGKTGRPIPRKWALLLWKELRIPATDVVWPNGIRD